MKKKLDSENLRHIAENLISHTETLEYICKKYSIDSRTIKFELLTYLQQKGNEKLLKDWLKIEPYKSKTTDVDYIAVIKHIIKTNCLVTSIIEKLEIPERTYRRNIAKLRSNETIDEETGLSYSELMELYDRYKTNTQIYGEQKIIDKIQIKSNLESSTREGKKIKKLENVIRTFEKYILKTNSEKEAIKLMQEEHPGITLRDITEYGKEYSGISTQIFYNKNREIYEKEKQGEEK